VCAADAGSVGSAGGVGVGGGGGGGGGGVGAVTIGVVAATSGGAPSRVPPHAPTSTAVIPSARVIMPYATAMSSTLVIVAQAAVGLVLAGANIVYWWFVVRRWHDAFRRWCERRYSVTITLGHRGHWLVSGSDKRWTTRFAIEMLQLVYFVAAFVGWAVGLLAGVAVIVLIQRAA
jgi:hypothetical protein